MFKRLYEDGVSEVAAPKAVETPNADTRERILDAAERLFMANGYEGTSMRQITSGAGVNLAAVNYHFGSKESLMQEVFRRRLDWLNDERMRILDALERESAGKPLKPSQIVDGFFGTLLRLADNEARGGMTFLRLLGRTLTEPTEFIHTFLAREYRTVVERYKEALFKALPDVPKAEIVWRFHFMLGATSFAIAGIDALRVVTDWQIEDEAEMDRFDRLLPRLMSFLLGGLRAPLPQFGGVAD
ncbi:MAG: TetR family transcriptional regulator [Proteobacteria bacterium]|nr:TetR family transcriptional regulator [Pseudomonadota bacterium]